MGLVDLFHKKNDSVTEHVLSESSFSKIQVKLKVADVELKVGSGFKATFIGPDCQVPTVQVNNDTLSVTQKHIFKAMNQIHMTRLEITVPENTVLEYAFLKSLFGNVDLTNITIKEFKSASCNGRIRLKRSNCHHANIINNEGKITIRSSQIDAGKLTTYSGLIKISSSKLTDLDLDLDDGNVFLSDTTLTNGQTKLKNGNFTLDHAVLQSNYKVINEEGTNTAWSVKVKAFKVKSGRNERLIEKEADGFILEMITNNGENVVE